MRVANLLLMAVAVPFAVCLRPELLSSQSISFAPRRDIPLGEQPSSVVTGDLDRDGNTDMVVTNHGSGDISVLLGNGDGTFAGEMVLVIEAGLPSAVATEDMDGDGRLDLVVTSDVDSSVTILLGNGDGTFQERSRHPVGNGPEGLVIADLDGDYNFDVATTDTFGDSISIALGNGNGTLRRANSLSIGQGPCGLAAGDLNNDGQLDLSVTLPHAGMVVTMIGSDSFYIRCVGDCSQDGRVSVDELVRGVNLALATSITGCPAFDRNGDGLVNVDELVRAVNSALNGCTMDGFLAGESPAGLLVSDFNGDGSADVAVANEGSDFVSVLDGFGDGTFDTSRDFPLGESSRALAGADFDGDGNLDLVMANTLADSVSVLPGNGDGTFAQAQSFRVHEAPSGGLSCQGLAIGDFNGDGLPDVVTANEGSNDVSVLLNESVVSQLRRHAFDASVVTSK